MNCFEKVLYFLQKTMEEPKMYGSFHIIWILLVILSLLLLYKKKDNYSEKQLKLVLGIYGIVALVLELLKQVVWSFNYDSVTQLVSWDYQWYAAPFQLCTTPIFACLICLFLKKSKIRDALLSYVAYITILGSFMTILLPDNCLCSTILVNIHTMWLHCGSFVVSIYLLMTKEVDVNTNNLKHGYFVFLIFVLIAQFLNISIYHSGLLNGETFNMFYISPYFISELPVFDFVQKSCPYVIYLMFYMFAILLGAIVVYFISLGAKTISKKLKSVFNHKII